MSGKIIWRKTTKVTSIPVIGSYTGYDLVQSSKNSRFAEKGTGLYRPGILVVP